MTIPVVTHQFFARHGQPASAGIIVERTLVEGEFGAKLTVQAFRPARDTYPDERVALSSKVTVTGSAHRRGIELFSDGTDLVIAERARGDHIGSLLMREAMQWAQQRFPNKPFGNDSGYIASISSSLAPGVINASRRNTLYSKTCGFAVAIDASGNGSIRFDPRRQADFSRVELRFDAARDVNGLRLPRDFAALERSTRRDFQDSPSIGRFSNSRPPPVNSAASKANLDWFWSQSSDPSIKSVPTESAFDSVSGFANGAARRPEPFVERRKYRP